MTDLDIKIKMARAIFGDELDHVLQEAQTQEKEAEHEIGTEYGRSYKESGTDFYQALESGELRDLWEAYKEVEAEDDYTELYEEDEETEKATAAKMGDYTELKADMTELKAGMSKLLAMLGGKQEEESKKEAQVMARIAELEEELSTLKGEQTRASGGYRASFNADPIQDSSPKNETDWQLQKQKAAQELGPASQMMGAASQLAAGLFGQQ